MLYPSIQELLQITSKDGKEKLNKYSITMATAKCARIITNEYQEQCHNQEKRFSNEKDVVKKEYRDEKAVKNALRGMKEGQFEVYLPNEEGYEDALVEIEDYVEPKVETVYTPFAVKVKESLEADEEEEEEEGIDEKYDVEELMGATNVFENDTGYDVRDEETNLI